MPNTYASSESSRRVERCSSRLNAGCAGRAALTLRLKVDSPSERCRILRTMIGEFVMAASTNACWQAALVPVDWCRVAPQIHSMKQSVMEIRTAGRQKCALVEVATDRSAVLEHA